MQVVVPIRWGKGSAAAPELHAPARSDGEQRPGNKTRVQERWERKTLLKGGNSGRSRKNIVQVAIGGIVLRELFRTGGSRGYGAAIVGQEIK